jgi:hypothetical protein
MANQEVLREFLISLGFQTDRSGQERFIRAVTDVTGVLTRFAIVSSAAAAAVGAMAVNMSRSLEGLYYSSQRVGSSVDSIRAFSFAVGQMGGNSDEARASIENLARVMRDNPGMRGFVASIVGPSVNTHDAVATMRALGQRFRGMEPHVARAYSGILGIDENTLRTIMQGTEAFEARYNAMARRLGMNSQESARHAVEFQNALRELELIGTFAVEKLVIALARIAPAMLSGAEQFTLWLERVLPLINDFIQSTIGWENALIVLGVALTAHLLSPLLRIAAVLGVLVGFRLPVWLLTMLGIGGAAAGAAAGAILLTPSTTNEGEAAALERQLRGEDPFPGMPQLNPDGTPQRDPTATTRLREWLQQRGWNFQGGAAAATPPARGAAAGGPALGQQALQYFISMGWSAQQAAGIVANLQHESGFNPQAFNPGGGGNGAFGLAQWRAQRQTALGSFIGRDFQTATSQEQLAFIHHELTQGAERAAGDLLRRAQDPSAAAGVVLRAYERPDARTLDAESITRGRTAEEWFGRAGGAQPQRLAPSSSVILNQRTEVHVTGSSDPRATGNAVRDEQARVNESLVRTMETAVR